MRHSVFLSYPTPIMQEQIDFINLLKEHLKMRGFEPRTLGVSDYDMQEPLAAIRQIMLESNGVITIAFRRYYIEKGASKYGSNIGINEQTIDSMWFTSPYCQIEPAMAYQLGLPLLILREKGVIADGILERGVSGTYLPEFDLSSNRNYLDSDEWQQIFAIWEGYVRSVIRKKGMPPRLY